MIRYLFGRAAQAVVTAWVVVTIGFVLLKMMPGQRANIVLGRSATAARVAAFNRANGLDQSLPVQYARFLASVLQGHITFASPHAVAASASTGSGFAQSVSLTQLASGPLRNTLILMGLSFVVAIPLGIAVGVWLATRRAFTRTAGSLVVSVAYGIPVFALGILVINVLQVDLPLLPVDVSPWLDGDVLSQPLGLVAPALTLTIGNAALIARYTESAAAHTLGEDYLLTARAKGAGSMRMLVHHALRNAGITVVTSVQLRLAAMFSIALPVEVVFGYPGLERLTWQAAGSDDSFTVLAALLVISAVVIVLSFAADILYALLDPRVGRA